MMCMLRVASESFDADGFLRDHAQLSPEALWHKGERRVIGGAALTNGFNLLVSEESTWNEVLRSALAYCSSNARTLQDARAANARLELDFGVEACEGGSFTVNARLSPEDLRELVGAGVTVCVTIYPPSRKAT